MTSRKEGIDPVVIALIRGIVIVGDVAWAVKGIAAPDLIRLWSTISNRPIFQCFQYLPLGKSESRARRIDEITARLSLFQKA